MVNVSVRALIVIEKHLYQGVNQMIPIKTYREIISSAEIKGYKALKKSTAAPQDKLDSGKMNSARNRRLAYGDWKIWFGGQCRASVRKG